MTDNNNFKEFIDLKREHKENIDDIIVDFGYSEFFEKREKISNLIDEINRNLDTIIDKIYTFIASNSKKKRITIDKNITIREGEIYTYGQSSKADPFEVIKYYDEILNEIKFKQKEAVRKIFNDIKYLDKSSDTIGRRKRPLWSKTPAITEYKKNNFLIIDISKYSHTSKSSQNIYDLKSTNKKSAIKESSFQDRLNIDSYRNTKIDKVFMISKYKEELLELMNDVIKDLQDTNAKINDINNYINEKFSKELSFEYL